MNDQLSLFEEKSPARFVAEIAHPYWTTSADRIDAYGDWYVEEGTEEGFIGTVKQLLEGLPSAQPEPEEFEWCTGCKEYDQDKHCCHRFTKVIIETVEELKQAQPGEQET